MKGRLQHIGVIVDDLAATRELLEDVLGLQLARAQSLPHIQTETAFFAYDQDVQVELIELNDAAERSRRLGTAQAARIEHIAIEVEDIDAARTELAGRGIQMQSEIPSRNGPTRSYFTRPETTRGIVFQLLDRRV